MYMRYLLSFAMALLCAASLSAQQPNKHIIGVHTAGFFSCFLGVLNQLYWCEENNKIPVVYWGAESLYYNPAGFNGSFNAWEYYFEPVSDLSYQPGDAVHNSYAMDKKPIFMWLWFDQPTREKANALISQYIKIKPVVQNKIDSFYREKMLGKKTIGIDIRGTDAANDHRLVDVKKVAEAALKHAGRNTQFFIATDEQKLLNQLIKLLKGHPVIYYNCYRSDNGQAIHVLKRYKKPKPHVSQLGEDVLVEVSLLAKTDMLIRTSSNVSTACLYFNPALPYVTVKNR